MKIYSGPFAFPPWFEGKKDTPRPFYPEKRKKKPTTYVCRPKTPTGIYQAKTQHKNRESQSKHSAIHNTTHTTTRSSASSERKTKEKHRYHRSIQRCTASRRCVCPQQAASFMHTGWLCLVHATNTPSSSFRGWHREFDRSKIIRQLNLVFITKKKNRQDPRLYFTERKHAK